MTYLYQLQRRWELQMDAATDRTVSNFKRDNVFSQRASALNFNKQVKKTHGRAYNVAVRLATIEFDAWAKNYTYRTSNDISLYGVSVISGPDYDVSKLKELLGCQSDATV